MNERQTIKISKFLSLVLRHDPQSIGLELDENGWTGVLSLISKVGPKFPGFNMAMLEEVVANNNKKRFAFNEDKTKIRANQGHSIKVDLDYEPVLPPEILYHGTVGRYSNIIAKDGIKKMSRHHVDLSLVDHSPQNQPRPPRVKIARHHQYLSVLLSLEH